MKRVGQVCTALVFLAAAIEPSANHLFGHIDLPVPQRSLRFIVTGDGGATHSRLRAGMLRVQQQQHIDAVLLAGDNFYPCGITSLNDPQWTKITQHFGPLHVPIYPVLGNHDYGDPQLAEGKLSTCGPTDPEAEIDKSQELPNWKFPARSYELDSPLVDFIMLDTQPIASGFTQPFRGSATAANDIDFLQRALSRATSTWRIVLGHHTIYSSGVHGRTHDELTANMRALLPMLEEHLTGADLYICGHDHDMELIGDHTGQVRPLFLISGAASGLDEMKPRPATEPPTLFPTKLQPYYGFAVLELNPLTMHITFYDQAGTQIGKTFAMVSRRRS